MGNNILMLLINMFGYDEGYILNHVNKIIEDDFVDLGDKDRNGKTALIMAIDINLHETTLLLIGKDNEGKNCPHDDNRKRDAQAAI
jgi:hypothetical protein